MHYFLQPVHHLLHRVTDTQGFTGGIGQSERRRIQRADVQMLGFQMCIQLRLIADDALTKTRHRFGERHHRHAAHQVVEDVEVDNQFRFRQRQFIHQIGQRMNKRQDNQAAHQLKQQATERHTACCGVSGAVIQHRQQTGPEVSTNHQTQRHRERDNTCRGQRGRQQHRRQAGVTDNRKHGANQRIEHNIAGERGKNNLYTISLGDRRYRLHNQLQRQQNQPQPNTDPPQLPHAGLLTAEKEDHADKNQQW